MDMNNKVITPSGKLDRWITFHDALVGYLFDNKKIKPGTRVVTEPLRFLDVSNSYAECRGESYKLGEPGTAEEHNQPLLGS
jgi:hypothetical protein